MPDFIKLYGRIPATLNAGTTYSIMVSDNFDSLSIGSDKYIYLSEIGIFGGKNLFLAWVFLGCTAFIALVLLFFFVFYFIKIHKKNRDTEDYLKTLKYF